MNWYTALLISVFTLGISFSCKSQIYLQLEKYNSTKTIKFYVGDMFEYRLKEFPDTWRKSMIIDILPGDNTIVLDDNFYTLDKFKEIRLNKPWAKSWGNKLMQFAGAWYLYGAIATLVYDDYTISESEIIIGGVFASIGFFIKTLFKRKRHKLGKRKRLRIMDLRFKVDPLQLNKINRP